MTYFGRLKSWAKARIIRITATTSKTAIAVLSAVIIAFVVSVSAFKSVRFFSWEHPGILIVVLAVAGEVICDWNRKKTLKERLKKFFGILLVAGLLLEIAEAVKSDKKASAAYLESADAKALAGEIETTNAQLVATNLVLLTKLLELEAKAADRHISEQQKTDFIKSLGNSPRGAVFAGVRHPDLETIKYSNQVLSMLTNAGFTIASTMNFSEDVSAFNNNSDIGILFDRIDDVPPYAHYLNKAFIDAGFHPTAFTNQVGRTYTPNEVHPGSNEVWILVGEKPD